MLNPKYAEIIVVGVRINTSIQWYVSNIENCNWVLDMDKRFHEFGKIGFSLTLEELRKRRNGIMIVERANAKDYLSSLDNEKVEVSQLRKMLENSEDKVAFAPSLFVDFDHEILYSNYPEMFEFENYIPEGWECTMGSKWMDEIPLEERYWVVDGQDLLKIKLGEGNHETGGQ